MTFERILFIQHGFSKITGHWLMETNEWRNAAKKLGIAWYGAAHVDLPAEVAAQYDMSPVFPFMPYDRIASSPLIMKLTSFIEIGDSFRHIGRQHFPKDISAKDLLFVPYTTDVELYGVARWLDAIPPASRPSVAFLFHQFDLAWKSDVKTMSVNGDFMYFEYAARALQQRLPNEKIRLFAAGDYLAKVLSKITRMPVATMPLASPCPIEAQPEKFFDVGIFGGARTEQGVEMWPEIMNRLAEKKPGVKVALQVQKPEQEAELRAKLSNNVDADIHMGQLYGADYYHRMLKCRLLLAPYDAGRYGFRESGVFIEATGRGIPSVVPAFTSMARFIENGKAVGMIYQNAHPSEIADATYTALQDIDALTAKAATVAGPWSQSHDTVNILKKLLTSF